MGLRKSERNAQNTQRYTHTFVPVAAGQHSFNGNVGKSKGDDAAVGPRPVHLVDGARAVTTQR